jgi:NTE family protein
MKNKKKYNLGLVLSGGGARGFAHIGVLKALEEKNIRPDVISGSSAGAIVGAFYADGYSPDQIYEIFSQKKLFKYFEFSKPGIGLMKISGLTNVLKDNLKAHTFEDLNIPLFVCAVDLNNGTEIYFSAGSIIKPLIASATIPILFHPVKINDSLFVDGGLLNNLPIEPIYYDCEKFIGVHVNPVSYLTDLNSMIKMAERCMHLSVTYNAYHKVDLFDLFIEPRDLVSYGTFEFSKAKEIFNIGYKSAKLALQKQKIFLETDIN